MAKRKFNFGKRAKSAIRYVKKAHRRSKGFSGKNIDLFDPIPLAYGFARPMAEQYLPKIGMLGAYSDNVLMGALAFGIHKTVKNKMAQDLAKNMLVCEKFLVGNDLNAQFLGQTAAKSQTAGATSGSW